jgi:isopenicillin N synthase-like dioxygenase
MDQGGNMGGSIPFSGLSCSKNIATADWMSTVERLYTSLSKGYAIIDLDRGPTDNTAILGCAHAFRGFFSLADEEKLRCAQDERALVRGYFNLSAKEVYETALRNDTAVHDAQLQPLLSAVRQCA